MKQLLLFIPLLPLLTYGQITISDNNFPNSGDQYVYSNANTNGLDISLTGSNISWDYSQLTNINQDTTTYVAVTSTPFAYQFYFNNSFIYPDYKADYGIKGIEINAFNQVTISDVFNFHKKNSSSLEMVGFGANINGIPASIKYDTIDQLYPLPLSYGASDSTSAYYLLDVPSLGAYGQHIQRKVAVDGWGSIVTPYQTYNQCLRVKTTLYQRDTLKVQQPFPLPGVAFNRPVQTTYEWFVNGVGVPVFSITQQGNTISNAKYLDANTSSFVEHQNNFDLKIYPNPSNSIINISTSQKDGTMHIIDYSGKLLYSGAYKTSIDISNYPKGQYVLTLTHEGQKGSLTIQKQ
ncbi:MAG: T9SS type A sorting domain-containing protein [Flavobacteriales bacterium]|jgi:hypothetical protein|nr:T9SS type A sorting domain-containing protein [Flavobacteriales bacterium]